MNSNPCIKNEIRASTDEICYADEIFGFASDEIKSTHRLSDFIRPQGGFHRQRRFHLPARVDLVEKPTCRNKSVFLAMGYKKDIIAVFAYEFELLHKIMKSLLMQG